MYSVVAKLQIVEWEGRSNYMTVNGQSTYEFLLTTCILHTRVAMAELSLWYISDVVSPSSDSKTVRVWSNVPVAT